MLPSNAQDSRRFWFRSIRMRHFILVLYSRHPSASQPTRSCSYFKILSCIIPPKSSIVDGRLLIPYLFPGRYYGLEPNRWLIEDGIIRQLGTELIELKRPNRFFPMLDQILFPLLFPASNVVSRRLAMFIQPAQLGGAEENLTRRDGCIRAVIPTMSKAYHAD